MSVSDDLKRVRQYRKRQKALQPYVDMLPAWMKMCRRGEKTQIALVTVGNKEMVLPIANKKWFLSMLNDYNFPHTVQIWTKKFAIECIAIEEDA